MEKHVSNICTKASRTLGFLRRNLAACPRDVKESAYKGLVRPILEYGSSVWDPQSLLLQDELETVQKRAARFVTDLKGAASIPTNDLVPPIRRIRNRHSLAFQIAIAGTDIYKSSFFPQTIRDWNLLTDSLISASECAVDSVTKFTSLVRARD